MAENSECCPSSNCGCRIDVLPTSRECPSCGKRLRLTGRAQLLQFRLSCQHCGYTSALLSQEEVRELL